jgi:hypothetical protein
MLVARASFGLGVRESKGIERRPPIERRTGIEL